MPAACNQRSIQQMLLHHYKAPGEHSKYTLQKRRGFNHRLLPPVKLYLVDLFHNSHCLLGNLSIRELLLNSFQQ